MQIVPEVEPGVVLCCWDMVSRSVAVKVGLGGAMVVDVGFWSCLGNGGFRV